MIGNTLVSVRGRGDDITHAEKQRLLTTSRSRVINGSTRWGGKIFSLETAALRVLRLI